MKNPMRKNAEPEKTPRELALAMVQINDTDRMERLVARGVAERKEIDAALMSDKKFVRKKLLAVRLTIGSPSMYEGYEAMMRRDVWEKTVGKEIERILIEECAS